MTSKEREEFKKKLEARKKQKELDSNNNTKPDNTTKDSDESKSKFSLIDLFKKAEELEPINLESLTPYEREEVKNKYKLMTLVFGIISLILILWILSWVV
jgi:hypothetical protein